MPDVILIDDHELAHQGMAMLLADTPFRLTECFARGGEAIAHCSAAKVDIVILDLDLPDMSGLTVLAELIARFKLAVVVLSGSNDPRAFATSLKFGALAAVSKGDPVTETLLALAAAVKGERYCSTGVALALARLGDAPVSLSGRQSAILQFLAEGLSNKEIGYRLEISQPTVSFHMTELRRKLAADNNRQLVSAAQRAGIL